MFGLEGHQKGKKEAEFTFELEKDFQNTKKHKELKERMQSRMLGVKEVLKSGTDKLDFDKIGVILYGYASFLKVMSRFNAK